MARCSTRGEGPRLGLLVLLKVWPPSISSLASELNFKIPRGYVTISLRSIVGS
jgi:hypothetical protein